MEHFDSISYSKMLDKSLQSEVVHRLSQYGLTLATAESCTGGLIASRITDISGSSATSSAIRREELPRAKAMMCSTFWKSIFRRLPNTLDRI